MYHSKPPFNTETTLLTHLVEFGVKAGYTANLDFAYGKLISKLIEYAEFIYRWNKYTSKLLNPSKEDMAKFWEVLEFLHTDVDNINTLWDIACDGFEADTEIKATEPKLESVVLDMKGYGEPYEGVAYIAFYVDSEEVDNKYRLKRANDFDNYWALVPIAYTKLQGFSHMFSEFAARYEKLYAKQQEHNRKRLLNQITK